MKMNDAIGMEYRDNMEKAARYCAILFYIIAELQARLGEKK